jgi:hypothetical protein
MRDGDFGRANPTPEGSKIECVGTLKCAEPTIRRRLSRFSGVGVGDAETMPRSRHAATHQLDEDGAVRHFGRTKPIVARTERSEIVRTEFTRSR